MPFTIVRQDITRMKVDAIVNAANTDLKMGGGVCGAIFKAAGEDDLQAACEELAPIQTGDAVITPGFGLPATYIIHTAGPVYRDGKNGEEEQLRLCYRNSLKQAVGSRCQSIAFPLISSGVYGYPKPEALRIATETIQDFLEEHELDVYLVVYDKATFTLSEQLLGEVGSYIDEHYIARHPSPRRGSNHVMPIQLQEIVPDHYDVSFDIKTPMVRSGIDDLVVRLDEPFSETLLRLIDAKGRTDVEIYKRANLDRKLFSKIRTGKGYTPSKRTAIALAVALELSLEETDDLLERAGYALSRSQKFDVIVEYFIVHGKYNIYEINEVLFRYDQPLLGG